MRIRRDAQRADVRLKVLELQVRVVIRDGIVAGGRKRSRAVLIPEKRFQRAAGRRAKVNMVDMVDMVDMVGMVDMVDMMDRAVGSDQYAEVQQQ